VRDLAVSAEAEGCTSIGGDSFVMFELAGVASSRYKVFESSAAAAATEGDDSSVARSPLRFSSSSSDLAEAVARLILQLIFLNKAKQRQGHLLVTVVSKSTSSTAARP